MATTKGKNVVRSRVSGDGDHTTSSKFDWQTIRREYVEGITGEDGEPHFPTQAELADRHGMKRKATLGQRAADEGWTDQRAAFRASLAKVRRRKRITELADEAGKFDGNVLSIAKLGTSLVQRRMAELAQDVREATDEERKRYTETGVRETVKSGVSPRELTELGRALAQFHTIAGHVFGDVEGDEFGLLPQETTDEREAARQLTVTHEHSVRVERTTLIEVAEVVAEIESQVREAAQAAIASGVVPEEEDPQDVEDAEIVDDEAASA